jgi:hypothetical protein
LLAIKTNKPVNKTMMTRGVLFFTASLLACMAVAPTYGFSPSSSGTSQQQQQQQQQRRRRVSSYTTTTTSTSSTTTTTTSLNGFGDAFKGAFSNDDNLGKRKNEGLAGGPDYNENVTVNGKTVPGAVVGQKLTVVASKVRVKIPVNCQQGDCGAYITIKSIDKTFVAFFFLDGWGD